MEIKTNTVVYIGRLTHEPELRKTEKGDYYACFTLAVNRINSDTADFPDCICYRKKAENLCKYTHKGDMLAVVGHTKTRIKDNKKMTECEIQELTFLNNSDRNEPTEDIDIPE